jgi:tRNA A37 threonylcarbamoyladenosine dehydratase
MKILLLGVGGVGGFCLDCLSRSGIKDITIIDFDSFEVSNQNRQLGSQNIEQAKVDYFAKNYDAITAINEKVTSTWCKEFDFSPYDLVIDAIDDMSAKVALANIVGDKLISSMGGAKRVDPTKIKIDSIWKTTGDKFAKKFRYELRASNFNGDFMVVYSDEEPKCTDMGSFVGVTGSFGLALCSLAIDRLRS